MKIAVSADEYHPIIDQLLGDIKKRGHEILYFGPRRDEKPQDWTTVTLISALESVLLYVLMRKQQRAPALGTMPMSSALALGSPLLHF